MATPSDVAYWQSRYDAGTTGWDLGAPTPAWAELTKLHAVPTGRTLVLGAGRGHDALWFARQGHSVLAVDFAQSAVADTQRAAKAAGVPLETLQEDLFNLSAARVGQFDVVVEHTCFCAIEPHRRADYVRIVSDIVRPGGWFLGVFFWHLPPGGPPFATSRDEVEALFSPYFDLVRLEPNPVSPGNRAGKEAWGVFRRKAASDV